MSSSALNDSTGNLLWPGARFAAVKFNHKSFVKQWLPDTTIIIFFADTKDIFNPAASRAYDPMRAQVPYAQHVANLLDAVPHGVPNLPYHSLN